LVLPLVTLAEAATRGEAGERRHDGLDQTGHDRGRCLVRGTLA
jgi:hypothetical protein